MLDKILERLFPYKHVLALADLVIEKQDTLIASMEVIVRLHGSDEAALEVCREERELDKDLIEAQKILIERYEQALNAAGVTYYG